MLTGQYVDPRAGTLTFAQWFTAYAAQQVWVDGTHEAAATAADSVPFVDVPISRIAPSHVQAWVKGHDDRDRRQARWPCGVDDPYQV